MKTIALLLLVLGAEPAPVLLLVSGAWVGGEPCPEGSGRQFCAHGTRFTFDIRMNQLTGTLEVFDAQGAKLHSLRTFGGVTTDGARVYYWDTDDVAFAIDLRNPKEAPKKLGKMDCGGPAAPSVHSVAGDVPLCVTDPDETKKELLIEGSGVCRVPPAAYESKNDGAYYLLTASKLSKACKKMLKLK